MPLRDRELITPQPTLLSLVGDRTERGDPAWLANQIAAIAGKSADEIAEELAQAAIKRHGGEARDDIAILVLRRQAQPV